MKDFLEKILKGIVKSPEKLEISERKENDNKIIYEIRAAEEDIGQIIGKNGRTIKSINVLMNAFSGGKNSNFTLKVIR
ncbi:MAG: KH domain-containing protein [Kosmotogaceae bacterium]